MKGSTQMSLHLVRSLWSSLRAVFRSGRLGSADTVAPQHLHTLLTHTAAPLVLDVRTPDEFLGERGHIPGARSCPLSELDATLAELKAYRKHPIVTV
jgi:3-mercaptopyruvate sulfurtransferase SseA